MVAAPAVLAAVREHDAGGGRQLVGPQRAGPRQPAGAAAPGPADRDLPPLLLRAALPILLFLEVRQIGRAHV